MRLAMTPEAEIELLEEAVHRGGSVVPIRPKCARCSTLEAENIALREQVERLTAAVQREAYHFDERAQSMGCGHVPGAGVGEGVDRADHARSRAADSQRHRDGQARAAQVAEVCLFASSEVAKHAHASVTR